MPEFLSPWIRETLSHLLWALWGAVVAVWTYRRALRRLRRDRNGGMMDPNANREEALRLARKLLELDDQTAIKRGPSYADMAEHGARLAELVLAMDGWLSKGGSLPKAWTRRTGITL